MGDIGKMARRRETLADTDPYYDESLDTRPLLDREVAKAMVKYRVLVAAETAHRTAQQDLGWTFAHLTADQQNQYLEAISEMEEEDRARRS